MPTRTSHAEGGGRMPVDRIVPPHAVDRPELLARLDVGMNAPLTLVVAPAGSGKSVLLTQWAATLGDARVAWLDVSAPDSDAVHFARRLLAELASLDPILADLGAPLGTAGGGLGEGLIEALAGAFAEVPGKSRRHLRRSAPTVEHRGRHRPVAAGGPAAAEHAFRLLLTGRPQARLESSPAAARTGRSFGRPSSRSILRARVWCSSGSCTGPSPRRWRRRSSSEPRGGPRASS